MSIARDLGYHDGYNSVFVKQAGMIDGVGAALLKLLGKAPDKMAAPALTAAAHGMPAGADLAAQKAHVLQSLGGFGIGAGGGLGAMAIANASQPSQQPTLPMQ